MNYNFKFKSILMVLTLLCLLGFSSVSNAVQLSGSCPVGHSHRGDDMAGMNMSDMGMGGGPNKAVQKLAEDQCSSCHGRDGNGISKSNDVPNLAGQDSVYLCAWLDVCRKQGKQCESHEDIAAQLSDQDIVGLAEFYAHSPSKW
jgi:cytochrome c553